MAAVVGRNRTPLIKALRGVCFVAPQLDRIGGYELATLALARAMRDQGIPVIVVTITRNNNVPTSLVDVIRVQVRGPHTLLSTFPKLLAVLARERCKYSVIHCPTFDHISGLAVLAGLILRRPTLVRVATHGDVAQFSNGRGIKARVFSRLLRQAARVIAPSVAISEDLSRAGFSTHQLVYLPNSVDVERFCPATESEKAELKRALGLDATQFVIGTVARLVKGKGIDVLLRAFSEVVHGRKLQLVLIGDGPLGHELRALARQLGIGESVSWPGWQTEPSKWLRAMDAFAFASSSEGSPNAVLEAMATALPIVATRIGGIIDLLDDGRTGLLVSPNDSGSFATALNRLLLDANLRAELSSRARARAVESFSLAPVTARLIQLYLTLQDGRMASANAAKQ